MGSRLPIVRLFSVSYCQVEARRGRAFLLSAGQLQNCTTTPNLLLPLLFNHHSQSALSKTQLHSPKPSCTHHQNFTKPSLFTSTPS